MATTYPGFGCIDLLDLFLVAALAFLVSLDERALGPLGFGQPLLAGVATGALLGRPADGLAIGIVLQSIWPALVPMGGSAQPDSGPAAIVGTAWMCAFRVTDPPIRIAIALGAAMMAASLGARLEEIARERNARREERVYAAGAPRLSQVRALIAAGALEAGLKGVVVWLCAALILIALVLVANWGLASHGALHAMRAASGMRMGISAMALAYVFATPTVAFAFGGCLRRSLPAWTRAGEIAGNDDRTSGVGARAGGSESAPSERAGRTHFSPCTLARTLFVQAAFSRRHLQRTGFLYIWLGGRVAARGHDAAAATTLGLAGGQPPNTHPVLAAAVAGALERVVADAGERPAPRPPLRLLEIAGPIFAQWGDRALWGGLRPATSLVALALLPLAPVAVIIAFAVAPVLLQISSRAFLYRWGWRSGWNLVTRRGALWRGLPRWAPRLVAPLAIAAIAVLLHALPHGRAGECASIIAAVWFIVGALFAGRSQQPGLAWGWLCTAAGSLGALLIWWCGQ